MSLQRQNIGEPQDSRVGPASSGNCVAIRGDGRVVSAAGAAPGSLAEGVAGHPEDEHDRRDDPQQMDREPKPGEEERQDQDEEDESHRQSLWRLAAGRPRRAGRLMDRRPGNAEVGYPSRSPNWARTGFSIAMA